MINNDTIKTINCIIKAVEKLQVFKLEDLEKELTKIPDSKQKNICIDWVLESSNIHQIYGIYYLCN